MGSPFFAPAAAPSAAVAINPAQQQRQKFASVLGTTAFSYREKAGSGAFGGFVRARHRGRLGMAVRDCVCVKVVVVVVVNGGVWGMLGWRYF